MKTNIAIALLVVVGLIGLYFVLNQPASTQTSVSPQPERQYTPKQPSDDAIRNLRIN